MVVAGLTWRNAALSVSFSASMQNCIRPVVCCNFPVQFICCSCKFGASIERKSRGKFNGFRSGIDECECEYVCRTLSILNLLSLSICNVSNKNSRRSWINWINASHCTITNCSNSWHDSYQSETCTKEKRKKKLSIHTRTANKIDSWVFVRPFGLSTSRVHVEDIAYRNFVTHSFESLNEFRRWSRFFR